ncbi:hypothetical protein D3C87_2001920 [compost metagenome]
MVDHQIDVLLRHGTVECNGIPVLFVHVIAWADLFMLLPQIGCDYRVAFQINNRLLQVILKNKCEHFTFDLDHQ